LPLQHWHDLCTINKTFIEEIGGMIKITETAEDQKTIALRLDEKVVGVMNNETDSRFDC
jgi:hypothetical protein